MRSRRRYGGGDAYAYLLLLQLGQQIMNSDHKPPVTLALIAGQVALHYNVLPGPADSVADLCFLPARILSAGLSSSTLRRLFWSPLLHGSDVHLLYNMLSFLLHGATLERKMGSERFGLALVALTLLSQMSELAIAVAARELFNYDGWLSECGIGFSGVIFALKVLLTFNAPGTLMFQGFQIPARHIAWAELLFISLVNPQASFVGHLSGIAGGLIFIGLQRQGFLGRRWFGPADAAAGGGDDARHGWRGAARNDWAQQPPRQRFFGSGTVGERGTPTAGAGVGAQRWREEQQRRDADLARQLQADEDRAATTLR